MLDAGYWMVELLKPYKIPVALNGCGYAARIGIRESVMDEVKKLT